MGESTTLVTAVPDEPAGPAGTRAPDQRDPGKNGAVPPTEPSADTRPGQPAEGEGSPAAAEPDADAEYEGPSLSPSRAGDFLTCPLLYRFRVIDRLPEPPSPAAARGTLVHAVLERLFDQPAPTRTLAAARSLLEPEWSRLLADDPELATLFQDDEEQAAWLAEAGRMLHSYFSLEDPRRLEPAHRELCVEADLSSGLRLRGYIDRLDVAPGGEIRIVDYKTGEAPPAEFEARALFQMKFYALTLWRSQGRVPRLLQLMYLGSGEIVRYAPDESDLLATERKVEALWRAIDRARVNQDWRPRPGRICDWCAHKPICPAFGGTPPPLPAESPALTDDQAPSTAESAAPTPQTPPLPAETAAPTPQTAPLPAETAGLTQEQLSQAGNESPAGIAD